MDKHLQMLIAALIVETEELLQAARELLEAQLPILVAVKGEKEVVPRHWRLTIHEVVLCNRLGANNEHELLHRIQARELLEKRHYERTVGCVVIERTTTSATRRGEQGRAARRGPHFAFPWLYPWVSKSIPAGKSIAFLNDQKLPDKVLGKL
jgi:hypothetical protein